jgi:RND family efflux transporter MFP subunit
MTTTHTSSPRIDRPAHAPPAHPPQTTSAPPQGAKRKILLGNLFIPALTLAGAGALWLYMGGGFHKDERDKLPPDELATSAPPSHLMVTAEPVAFRPVQRVVEAVGTLYGFEEIVISAKVEGRVLRIHHEVADRVSPGEVLVEIDPTDYQLGVEQAESSMQVELAKLGLQSPPDGNFDLSKVPTVMLAQARVDNTQSKLERTKRLAVDNGASKGDVENAISEFRTTQADHANQILLAKSGLATIKLRQSALAVSQQQLADTRVVVPSPRLMRESMAYVITKRSVAEGSFVRAGGEICKLVIDETLKLRVPVPERFSAQVKLGQQAEVFTAAFQDAFTGTVTLISPAVDPTTRTFEVEIQIANVQGHLKPGSFAKAVIHTSQTEEAPTVPLSALVTFAGVTKVFLAQNGKAKEVIITSGVQTREWIEIAHPELDRDAVVITSGQASLANDTPISIRKAATAKISPTSSSQSKSANRIANED